MNNAERPEVNQVLFVTEADKQKIAAWPMALRALFDPQTDLELARRIERERLKARTNTITEDEIPF
jgi:hypothetical protein